MSMPTRQPVPPEALRAAVPERDAHAASPRRRVSLLVPVYNEEDAIDLFLARIGPALEEALLYLAPNGDHEIVFVDDGSTDGTWRVLQEMATAHPTVRAVRLSRNFGKESALACGLSRARGAAVVPMDVDLQDPPSLLPRMVAAWRDGFEMVLARRTDRSRDSVPKRLSAAGFYRVFNLLSDHAIPENVGDFRLMDRRVVDAVLQLRENSRFNKGLFDWVGFRRTVVDYERPVRIAGVTTFTSMRLWRLALDGIVSFSSLPLRIWTYVGFGVSTFAFVYMLFIVLYTLIEGRDVPGYASLLSVVLFLGGVQLISLGVIGEYLSRIYMEVKGRPLFIVAEEA